LVLAALLGLASYAIRLETGSYIGLVGVILLELGITALFLLILPKVGSTWLQESWKLIRDRRQLNNSYAAVAVNSHNVE
jgi:hypothetical protein